MEYGKRLCELLKEQQEPWLLDDYLIQNGYSRRAPRCHQRSALCCSLSVCKKLLKRKPRGGTSGTTPLRSVLNKIMCRNAIRKLMNWGCGKQIEFRRLEISFNGDSNGDGDEWKEMEVSSRQLSPVSVFELHSDEDSSPTHEHTNFKDEKVSNGAAVLQVSTDSSFQDDFISMQSNLLVKDVQEMIWEPQESLKSQMNSKQLTDEQVLSREKITKEITKIPILVEYDFTKSKREWCQLMKQDMGEIGNEIETLIFEEIRSEAVLDLLGSHCTL